jgi:uncharacterized protein
MDMKLSQYHVVTQPFFDEIEERSKRVLFATRTSSVRVIDEISWKILESGNFENLPKETLFELVDIELLVPANEDELTTILNRNDAAILDDDILFFSIQPTAMCQLGCHYCGQEHKNKLLIDEYQQLLIQRARAKLEAKKVRKLAITWFGAEPLIGLPAIRTLTP